MRAVAGLALILLAACHPLTKPAPRPAGSWAERQTQLQTADRWRFEGRFAISGVESGESGGIRWTQNDSRSDVSVFGPLGAGALEIALDGDKLRVKTSRGEALDGDEARQLIEDRLGAALPLDAMRYWLLGVAAPGSEANETLGDNQRLAALSQQGWDVHFAEYQPVAGDLLPARVDAVRAGVKVKLRIARWLWE
ncbi:MAG: lipoprotein insertase outer membrane protein LolB [Steroidobacteraceae bacterium]